MPSVYVYWKSPSFDLLESGGEPRAVHQGILTTDHEEAENGEPVLVEEESQRVWRPGELPPDTVLYVEAAPGDMQDVAVRAQRAGYRVERA